MRQIDAELYQDIQDGNICRLIKLTTKTGEVYGWCDSDMPLIVEGVTYNPAPALRSLDYVSTADTEVSAQQISAGWVDVPEQDIASGILDGAEVEASWASHENPQNGRLVVFLGKIDNITYTENGFKAEIMSFMKQLERNIGQVYSASCRHKLFSTQKPGHSGACLLSETSYTFNATVSAVVKNRWKFEASGLTQTEGYFSNGKLTFTSGNNKGLHFQVKTHSAGGTLELFLPTGKYINVGDNFTIQAGCDKTFETCKSKFNNVVNFGGFPHINPNVNYR